MSGFVKTGHYPNLAGPRPAAYRSRMYAWPDAAIMALVVVILAVAAWDARHYAREHPRLFVCAVLCAILTQLAVQSCLAHGEYPY